VGVYALIVHFMNQNFREHQLEMDEEQKKTGLIPQL
jgi:hypothetical protein